MALINCPECAKQISDRCVSCPNCGFPLAEMKKEEVKPTTKEEWMELVAKPLVAMQLKNPESIRFDGFDIIDTDAYGRTYAEFIVHATNSYGAYMPSRHCMGFYDVTDTAPCVGINGTLREIPSVLPNVQRASVRKYMKFGMSRKPGELEREKPTWICPKCCEAVANERCWRCGTRRSIDNRLET